MTQRFARKPIDELQPIDDGHSLKRVMGAGDLVMLPGRCSGVGQPTAWIAVDILRLLDGVLAEPWDVSQDEATRESSTSGLPMFGEPCGA